MKQFILVLITLSILLFIPRGCSMLWNNRNIDKTAYHTVSYATGYTGHTEFTEYQDGSYDVKIYPGLGHRMWDSVLYQDLDGNETVDRIRRNGAEWKMNHLSELLVRKYDYTKYKKKFDKADKLLRKLIKKHSKQ